jgi:ribosomal protein S18 acetylase RimI-like enzyme
VIREAKINDLDQIFMIERMSFLSERFSKDCLRYLINKAKSKVIVYERHKNLCGYAITLFHTKRCHARLYSIAVRPSDRGYQIGSELLKKSEQIAVLYKHQMQLEVRPSNMRAIRFYKGHGYKQVGLKMNYYQDGEGAYIFSKDLRCKQV